MRFDLFFHYLSSTSFLVTLLMTLLTFDCAVFLPERIVNAVAKNAEKSRKKEYTTIAAAADEKGLPRMLVDIRHGKKS